MRKTGGRTSAYVNSGSGEQGFWSSYADMMSAVALILFFLMLLSYIQNLITGNDLQSTQNALADTRVQLGIFQTQVADAEAELNAITLDLDAARTELEEQEGFIALQQASIDEQAKNIAAQQKVIEDQNAQAALQQKYLDSTRKEITELRGQMQTIAVLRLSILEQIKESIEKVMGGGGKVSIGENGTIILSESILFDFGSSEVKAGSTQMLNQLSKVFSTFLADDANAKYVDSIVISGHTDSTGNAKANRSLSTDRANNVLTFLLDANSGSLNTYARYFCAAGYGATRPVATNNTDEGRAANRRIEISIILKDETVLDIVEDYLAIEVPPAATTPAAGRK